MQTKTQTKNKVQSLAVQQELKALKKQINEGHDTVEQMVARVKSDGNKILTEAILEGDRLLRVKKLVQYGSFGRWIKDNCKRISLRTAQRYMTLATRKAELLKTDIGLRKAYALVGIIHEVGDEAIIETETKTVTQPIVDTTPHQSLAQKAGAKARSVTTAQPMINKNDTMSRAKYLASELTIELNSKLINNSIVKDDARQILQPLLALLD
ncbi:MAG: DUF3102 domain-containing protein [Verrucomicrobiota bacterium]